MDKIKKHKETGVSPNIKTNSLKEIAGVTGNLYEALNIISRRSNQIGVELKEELHAKLEEFSSSADNLEEVHENREQIEISRFYERLPHPTLLATTEFMDGKVYYRPVEEEETEEGQAES